MLWCPVRVGRRMLLLLHVTHGGNCLLWWSLLMLHTNELLTNTWWCVRWWLVAIK